MSLMLAAKLLSKNETSKALQVVKLVGPNVIVRTDSHLNRDWQPGPLPRTEEERIAAAKKYNLLPEEYEPYPDDGFGLGDYPNLPTLCEDDRDQYVAYDYAAVCHNYNEPWHLNANLYTNDRLGFNQNKKKYSWSGRKVIAIWSATFAFVTACWWIFHKWSFTRHFNPVMAKQPYYPGQVRYYYPGHEDYEHHH